MLGRWVLIRSPLAMGWSPSPTTCRSAAAMAVNGRYTSGAWPELQTWQLGQAEPWLEKHRFSKTGQHHSASVRGTELLHYKRTSLDDHISHKISQSYDGIPYQTHPYSSILIPYSNRSPARGSIPPLEHIIKMEQEAVDGSTQHISSLQTVQVSTGPQIGSPKIA